MDVLIIEDHAALAANIGEYLEGQGHTVDYASDGAMGLRLCAAHDFDVIVLDLRLPRLDGIELCRRLRTQYADPPPVLMLTARDTVDDRIAGFEAGADDYLTKPFSLRELYLRLCAVARRSRAETGAAPLRAGELAIDTARHTAFWGQTPIDLTPTTFRILRLLVETHPGVVTRGDIEQAIWQDRPPDSDAALRGHIHRLRQMVAAPAGYPVVKTLHGIGYRLDIAQ